MLKSCTLECPYPLTNYCDAFSSRNDGFCTQSSSEVKARDLTLSNVTLTSTSCLDPGHGTFKLNYGGEMLSLGLGCAMTCNGGKEVLSDLHGELIGKPNVLMSCSTIEGSVALTNGEYFQDVLCHWYYYSYLQATYFQYNSNCNSRNTIMRWLKQVHEIILNISDHHPFLQTCFPLWT